MAHAIKAHSTIVELAGDAWDVLAGGPELHLSSQWLGSVEAHSPGKPVYLVHHDEHRRIAGSAVSYLIDNSRERADDVLLRFSRIDCLLANAISGQDAGNAHSPTLRRLLPGLSCGGWTLTNSTTSLSSDLDSGERRELGAELVRGLIEAAREMGARCVYFPYVEQHNHELRENLLASEFKEFSTEAHYLLDVTWSSFDEYVAHFAKRRRYNIRRDHDLLARAGVGFRVVPLEPALVEDLLPLGMATVRKYQGTVSEHAVRDRLRLLSEVGSQVAVAEHDGTIRAFGVLAQWRDHLYARMTGFDYEFQKDLPLYFGILYAQIRHAIAGGFRRIEYATNSGFTKMSRGMRPIPQYGYLLAFDRADSADVAALLETR